MEPLHAGALAAAFILSAVLSLGVAAHRYGSGPR
jgi:hypothetical protein